MKKTHIMIACGLVAAAATVATFGYAQAQQNSPAQAEAAAPAAAPVSAEQAKKAFSYLIGFQFGQQVSAGLSTLSVDDFDKDTFFAAVADSLKGSQPAMTQEEIAAGMDEFVKVIETREKAVAEANAEKGKAFQAEFAKQEGVTKTESGLQYRVLTAGDGRKYDAAQDGEDALASITYEGKLIDGTTFDKAETPVDMPVNQVVPGFSEALKLMPIGSEWEVFIPGELAYGERATGPIPSNATLVFTIKLVDIKKNTAPAGGAMQLTPEMIQQLQAQGLEVMGEEDVVPAEAPAEVPAAEAPAAE